MGLKLETEGGLRAGSRCGIYNPIFLRAGFAGFEKFAGGIPRDPAPKYGIIRIIHYKQSNHVLITFIDIRNVQQQLSNNN